ncbi:hypothetical protein ACHAQJ_006315 [Trichoderma viride]
MPRFKAPYPGSQRSRNTAWARAAHPGMSDADHLWRDYWERFNTIQIPIFSEEEYFQTAIAVAKASKDKEDFERIFEETNKQRGEIFRVLMRDISWKIDNSKERFPSRAAFLTTFDACNNSCLEHFVGLLKGNVFGWEADVEELDAESEALSDDGDGTTKIGEETQIPLKEEKQISVEEETQIPVDEETQNPLKEETQMPIEEETQTPVEEETQIPVERELQSPIEEETRGTIEEKKTPVDWYDYSLNSEILPEWETQYDPEWDWTYRSPNERKASRERYGEDFVFLGTYSEYYAPTSDDTAPRALVSDDEIPSMQQLPPSLLSDTPVSEKGDEGNTTQDVLGKQLSSPSNSGSSTLAKKRVRFDVDDDIIDPEPKRRKLENATTHTPTSPTPHSSSSIQQAAGGSVSKKRSRSDDDDEEEEDNGYKRQRIESLPSPPTSHTTPASSTEDVSINHLSPGNPEKLPEKQDPETTNGGRRRRKQTSTSRTPRAKSSRNILNTRSSRRAKSSTLWELDSSGKPHSV